ncbi:type IV pilus biogenesis/stability protein PilW [Solemya pervernicosa gill symbiont]|uniref:Type IV pilus biogenesis/stability protein PilW n=2 Tax=Gammaproteobacteria incertae sedis TaxID=118884 RepID=A0A1T2LAX0_9GAMM|nr:type IV pilus biogenesis/stability protein PilW [Candidatus Reidiella endopervernicosa]OOZ42194.1 type IV pilus biogenesis/stability protein PilW [Solemya pervernicosa gill symbiont]QKQ27238.1 type IV pilus biogenesis/stability protein PilW [Candidatus Reidiella endopervernicosa]
MSRVAVVLVMVSALLVGCASDSSKSEAPEQGRDQQVAQLNLQLGINYMRSGDNGQAMEKLQRSLAHDQSNAVTHSTIALLYSRLRDNPKAEHHYQRSIALNPDDAMTRANFGSFLCSRGSYRKAVEQYQRAWSNPANRQPEVAYASAGICLSSSGDKVRAEQYLRKALEINKRYPLALMQMAELTFKSKKYLSARAYLQRLGAPAQLGERALYIGFHAENSLGDKEMARRYRGELFKRYPGSEEARKLQGEDDEYRRGVGER